MDAASGELHASSPDRSAPGLHRARRRQDLGSTKLTLTARLPWLSLAPLLPVRGPCHASLTPSAFDGDHTNSIAVRAERELFTVTNPCLIQNTDTQAYREAHMSTKTYKTRHNTQTDIYSCPQATNLVAYKCTHATRTINAQGREKELQMRIRISFSAPAPLFPGVRSATPSMCLFKV